MEDSTVIVRSPFGNEDIFYLQTFAPDFTVMIARAVRAEGGGYSVVNPVTALFSAMHSELIGAPVPIKDFAEYGDRFLEALLVARSFLRASRISEYVKAMRYFLNDQDSGSHLIPRPEDNPNGSEATMLRELKAISGELIIEMLRAKS